MAALAPNLWSTVEIVKTPRKAALIDTSVS